ncbi:MAG: hypothetical protein EBT79_07460 [Actinobacteria bacterium]|nr:hypothetical protein [Actinomycetota bacterium]NBR67096.1 hypothetical protein [Actinomycetota bacterium]
MKSTKYALRKGNQFLNTADEFKSPALYHKDTVRFDTEDAALDKAVALGLHLDTIDVMGLQVREPTAP